MSNRGQRIGTSGSSALRDPVWERDLLLILAGVLTAGVLTWGVLAGVWFVVLAIPLGAAVVLTVRYRGRLARIRLVGLFCAFGATLPALAIMGPALAAPDAPSAFGFRVVLGLALILAIVLLVLGPARLEIGSRALLFALGAWYTWMIVSLLWAPDKMVGLRYLVVVFSMLALTIVTVALARRRPYFAWLIWLLAAVLVFTVLLATVELAAGFHLPGSAALDARSSGSRATAWFVNTNDLATFLAIAWPFTLYGAVVAEKVRLRWSAALLSLAVLGIVLFTGSRTSLLAIGLETLVVAVLLLRARTAGRRRTVVAAVMVTVLLGGVLFLALNNAESGFMSRFRLITLVENVQSGSGSGDVRLDLARAGAGAVHRYYYLGVGPGNAEQLTEEAEQVTVDFGNLHSWWFEVFVNSGVPGFSFFMIFYLGLIVVAWRSLRCRTGRADLWLAGATFTALVGWSVGAFGPSTSVSFAPMWILYGLGLAVAARALHGADTQPHAAPTADRRAGAAHHQSTSRPALDGRS